MKDRILELVEGYSNKKKEVLIVSEELNEEVLDLGRYLSLRKQVHDEAEKLVNLGRGKFDDEDWNYLVNIKDRAKKMLDAFNNTTFRRNYDQYKNDRVLKLSVKKNREDLLKIKELESKIKKPSHIETVNEQLKKLNEITWRTSTESE